MTFYIALAIYFIEGNWDRGKEIKTWRMKKKRIKKKQMTVYFLIIIIVDSPSHIWLYKLNSTEEERLTGNRLCSCVES